MKVLHAIDALGVGGGAEHSLAAMLPRLRDLGVESSVVTLIPREGGLQERLRDEGFRVDVLPTSSWPGRVRAMRAAIKDQQPDVVHATLLNSCLVARAASIRSTVPLLNSLVNTTYDPVRLQGLDVSPRKLDVLRRIDGFTARHFVDHFHALTEAVRTEGTDVLGIDGDRITVVPRGRPMPSLPADPAAARLVIREELEVDADAPMLLNLARQDHQKAQPELIRAFAQVVEQIPDAVLVLAGRAGDATPNIERAIDETGVGASIRMPGHRTDVPLIYTAADVFVFPSHYEGFGGTLIEAMSVGTPIIGSDAPAIAEVLGHGEFGVVVPRGDIDGLGSAMVDLLGDAGRRAEFSRRGVEQFAARYEIGEVTNAMLELYRSVARRS